MKKIEFMAKDNTLQPALFYKAENSNRPLLVALHTWSFDMYNQEEYLLKYAEAEDWNLLLPNFRGPNKKDNPQCKEACGSDLAISDILNSTQYIIDNYEIDEGNIYLFGGSGGGHAALLTVAANPSLWNTVIAYVPIVDLRKWHRECVDGGLDFSGDIEACVGPCTYDNTEYERRSPISYLDSLAKVNRLKIFAGKFDNIVSINQSMELYARLQRQYPRANIFFEVFEGGHFVNYDRVINYFKDKDLVGLLDLSQ